MTVQIDSETANIPKVMFTEQGSDPAAPSAGYAALYIKAGVLYVRTSSGILSPLTNPMTTPADLIVGGTAGAPARLAKGSDGQVLTVDPSTHLLVWATPATGAVATDPIWDAAGDLAVGSGADTAVKLSKGSNSQVLTVDPADSAVKWKDPAAGGGDQLIEEQTVGAGGVASVTFSAIPGTFKTLLLEFEARTENATPKELWLTFNGDGGANYTGFWLRFIYGGASTPDGATGMTHVRVAWLIPSGVTAGQAGVSRTIFPNYARTTYYKVATSNLWYCGGGSIGDLQVWHAWHQWLNTAAITSLTLTPTDSDIAEGSYFALYGIK